MIRILGSVLLIFFATAQATCQCAIKPIKPIPPIGCKDVTPECVSDGNGKSHWNWICVPDTAPTATSNEWKPSVRSAGTPGGASQSTVQPAAHNPGTGVMRNLILNCQSEYR